MASASSPSISASHPKHLTFTGSSCSPQDTRTIADMNVDYCEWPPSAGLSGVVLAYWRGTGDGRSVASPTILPDAYVDIHMNLGSAVTPPRPKLQGKQAAHPSHQTQHACN